MSKATSSSPGIGYLVFDLGGLSGNVIQLRYGFRFPCCPGHPGYVAGLVNGFDGLIGPSYPTNAPANGRRGCRLDSDNICRIFSPSNNTIHTVNWPRIVPDIIPPKCEKARFQSRRIDKINRIIPHIPAEVIIPGGEPQRVFREKLAGGGVIPAGAVVVEAGEIIILAPRIFEAVAGRRVRFGNDIAEGIVVNLV